MNGEKVYSIERNENEEIRLTLKEYKSKKYVDIRIFFQPQNEKEMYPTKKGITITVGQLGELAKGLKQLSQFVREEEIV